MHLFSRRVCASEQDVINESLMQSERSNVATQESGSETEFEGGFKVPGVMWNKLYR